MILLLPKTLWNTISSYVRMYLELKLMNICYGHDDNKNTPTQLIFIRKRYEYVSLIANDLSIIVSV